MAASRVRGAMDGFDDSSSDEDDRRVVRRRPAATRGGHASRRAPALRSDLAEADASHDAYVMAREEAAFARATEAHKAMVEEEAARGGPPPEVTAPSTPKGSASAAGKPGDPVSAAEAAARATAMVAALTEDEHAALRARLLLPLRPDVGITQCFVVRQKRIMGTPVWRLFSEADGSFLMSAQKRSGSRTSNILMAVEATPTRDSGRVLGKVRSNFSGSVYTVFDSGMAPEDAVTDASLRQELAVVGFDWDQMGPGKMRAAVPRVRPSGAPVVFRARAPVDSLAASAASGDTGRIVMLQNKRPRWDESVQGHVLNFGGRVTESSVKNFQLGCVETGDATILQFGRVGKDHFTLDFSHPLSHVQALGIVMAAIDGKLADRKALKSLAGRTPAEDEGAWFAHWADP